MRLFNIFYTFPQYLSFAIIIFLIVSIVEKKKMFETIGLVLTILMGIFSLYFLVNKSLTPDGDIYQKIILERGGSKKSTINPAELLAPYFFYTVPMVLSILLLIVKKPKEKYHKWLLYSIILLEIIAFLLLKGAISNI